MEHSEMRSVRHYALVKVASNALQELFSPNAQGAPVCLAGLPKGAKCVGVNFDALRAEWVIRYEHESFPATREGDAIPVLDVWYTHPGDETERV